MEQFAYPTAEHATAASTAVQFFSHQPDVEAILLLASLARGKGTRESDVDLAVLVPPEMPREQRVAQEPEWERFYQAEPVFAALERLGAFTHVDADFTDGCFQPGERGWTSGPDEFELEIGNIVAYSAPLWEGNDRYRRLREEWLPYYGEDLRRQRLADAVRYCRNNLQHIPLYVDRALPFQAFDRLYKAFQEFLQALFIARRIYPVAYDKWIRQQIEELLGLPELYPRVVDLLQISKFESGEIAEKGLALEALLREYVEPSLDAEG